MIELTNEVREPKRGKRLSILLALALIAGGYWIGCAAIVYYHKAIRAAVEIAIKHDIAQTGITGDSDKRVMYATATRLDDCQERLEAVRLSIIDLPLGGPQK